MNTKNTALFIFLMLTNVVSMHAMRLSEQEQTAEHQKYNLSGMPLLIDTKSLYDKLYRTSEEQRTEQDALKDLQQEHYYVHATNDQTNGIWVNKKFLKKNYGTLKNMITDWEKTQESKIIPIGVFPIEVISLGFSVLDNDSMVPYLSFTELINVANIFNFLDTPADKMETVLKMMLANLNKVPDETLKKLNPDVQKSLKDLRCRMQYYLYTQGDPFNGIWVDKKLIKENCEVLKNVIADFVETQEIRFPISLFSTAIIQLGFNILANDITVSDLSFTELIDVANIFNYLEVPIDKMRTVLGIILINKIPDQELKKLNPDVQKSLKKMQCEPWKY